MNNLPLQPIEWREYGNINGTSVDAITPICEYDIYLSNNEPSYIVAYYNRHTEAPTKEATGFATIDDAKAWAWNHYNEKMQPYVVPDSITDIANWFKAAKPEPTNADICTQLGCHFEEFAENLEAINGNADDLHDDANDLKSAGKTLPQADIDQFVSLIKPLGLLDALCDQIVTATGVAYMMGFDIEGALKEVIRSNNSKMVDGRFEFDDNGKIMKPDSYSQPDLTPFVKQGE